MSVKIIAVDMDGTFLDNNSEYDRARFREQYIEMKKMGIHFVVASGNQYYQLASFFPEIRDEIAFVAENGALVIDAGTQVFHGELESQQVTNINNILENYGGIDFVVCGLRSAWVKKSTPRSFLDIMRKYYHRLQLVDTYDQIDDVIFKYALSLDDAAIPALYGSLSTSLHGTVKPVTSGHGFMDLIIPGVHKASGIQRLMNRWKITAEEIAAFGDSGNDIEMLSLATYSFSMENASDSVKNVSVFNAGKNTENGVLDVIDRILLRQEPFAKN
ncbi:sugar-phosphatase [Citrobacter freundii complex sp. CFNIH2]|uniref:Cof-type HAD-IIB family hydrolase n=1 Tax=Citrobacter freundii complex sp. CFNIH2 TaxID=2066049 RepID=UPI000C86CB96|nr:Cof-type HAD-IIB family hydrolase [Citrobacter freundii complex sp. CFNIH2]AUO66024.1 sugar-phosphatase [Citrobacter freundii complex sp. CFNIH2]